MIASMHAASGAVASPCRPLARAAARRRAKCSSVLLATTRAAGYAGSVMARRPLSLKVDESVVSQQSPPGYKSAVTFISQVAARSARPSDGETRAAAPFPFTQHLQDRTCCPVGPAVKLSTLPRPEKF